MRLANLEDNEKGNKFEELLRHTIPSVPELEIGQCWGWKTLPSQIRADIFPGTTKQDNGIDLVAQRNDGTYIAIQAKCYRPDKVLGISDIQTAPNAMVWRRNVSQCWLITTCRWTKNIEQQLGEGWTFIHAPTKWINEPIQRESIVPNELDRLQQEAFENVLNGYDQGHDRGRLIMACGTGKTLVSQRVAEATAVTGKNGLALYATPSIALTAQSRQAWLKEAKREIRTVVVCSDSQAGRTTHRYTTEIEAPATTDPTRIVQLVNQAQESLTRIMHKMKRVRPLL